MSVDTVAKLHGKVSEYDILSFLIQNIDKDARIRDFATDIFDEPEGVKARYDDSGKWIVKRGFISFKEPSGEQRNLFYMYQNLNFHENLSYYLDSGRKDLVEMVQSETTHLSLGKWGHSVDIMKAIVENFGGWIDESDCDDNLFYYIPRKSDVSQEDSILTEENGFLVEFNHLYSGWIINPQFDVKEFISKGYRVFHKDGSYAGLLAIEKHAIWNVEESSLLKIK